MGHGGVGGYVYMYKHTEVKFETGYLIYEEAQKNHTQEKTYMIRQNRG